MERKTRADRLATGVPLDDKTWADLIAAAMSVGVDATGTGFEPGTESMW
jgi:LDH2 family malate/lactate/ureidoglycolate dehydrogenase